MLPADSPATQDGIPVAQCIEPKVIRKKIARSSSCVPPEVLRGDHLMSLPPVNSTGEKGSRAGAVEPPDQAVAVGDASLGNDVSERVLRTRSAEELEHYRMTAGILCEPYRDVKMVYDMGDGIGEGSSGIIRKCFHKETGGLYACKSIPKSKLLCPEAVDDVKNEVKVMRAMGRHPCILELKDAFEDHYAVHLILEYCDGGDLYERIQQRKQYSEMEAARVCRRLLSAVHHFHGHGFMHRDIKPENILLAHKDNHVDIRLADFGQSVHLRPGKILTQTVGSVFYVAPEVLHKSYNNTADMWSVGIILYILLSGKPPFAGPNRRSTFELIKYAPVDFSREVWNNVSAEAKDLVSRLLDRNPETRISSHEAKLHPWMMKYCPTIQTASTMKRMIHGEPSPMSTLNSSFSDFSISPASSNASSPAHSGLLRGLSGDHRPMIPAIVRLGHGLPKSPSSSTAMTAFVPSEQQPNGSDSPPDEKLLTFSSLPVGNANLSLAAPAVDKSGLGRKFSLDSGAPGTVPHANGRRSNLRQ